MCGLMAEFKVRYEDSFFGYRWLVRDEVAGMLHDGEISKSDILGVKMPEEWGEPMTAKELHPVQWARLLRKQRRNINNKTFIKMLDYTFGKF